VTWVVSGESRPTGNEPTGRGLLHSYAKYRYALQNTLVGDVSYCTDGTVGGGEASAPTFTSLQSYGILKPHVLEHINLNKKKSKRLVFTRALGLDSQAYGCC